MADNIKDMLNQEYTMKSGEVIKVIAARTCQSLDVQFSDGSIRYAVNKYSIEAGCVTHPNRVEQYQKSKQVSHLNETAMMSCNMKATIVTYRKYADIDVLFENGVLKQHVSYKAFQGGQVSPEVSNRNRTVYATHLEDASQNTTFVCCKECAKHFERKGSTIVTAIKEQRFIDGYLLSYDGYIDNIQEIYLSKQRKPYIQPEEEHSLAKMFPKLASEWHPTKNGTLTPQDVSSACDLVVWWKCKHGHEWEAKVAYRAPYHRCPYCANQKVWPGYNDLATKNPDIAAEWHPTKNGDLTPQDVISGSKQKVWWLGKCGHTWQATVKSRTDPKHPAGCQVCNNRVVEAGVNDLETKHPEIAAQWHPIKNGTVTPRDVMFRSHKKFWFQCPICGNDWEATLENRSRAGTGCPHCTNKTSFNEQALFYYARQMCADAMNRAQIAGKEADIYIPSLNVVGEYDGWRHNEEKITADIEKAKHMQTRGMSFFRIREPSSATLPETIGECFNLSSLKSGEIECAIRWFLEQIHVLCPHLSVPDVDLQRDQTAIHAQLTRTTLSNSIAECRPDLLEEWDWEKNGILKPDMVAKSSNRKVWWKCKSGHSWQATPNRRMAGTNCPHCRSEKLQIIATNINDSADQIIFASRREAAKYFHLHYSNVAKRVKSHKPLSGYILEEYIAAS